MTKPTMRRAVSVYGIALAVVAAALALGGILYEARVAPIESDELASLAYRRLQEGRRAESLRLFALAVRRDRASPYRWCDYGEALLAAGDVGGARGAMERGLECGPAIAPILVRQVNFARRVGDAAGALRHGSRLVALAPDYDDAVFTAWDRMDVPVSTQLASLPGRRAAQSWLRHAASAPKLEPALAAWPWLLNKNYADAALADEFAAALVERREPGAAWQAWIAWAGAREPGYPDRNTIFDPGFERAPAGRTFDWRFDPTPGVSTARDLAEGRASLRLDFDGTANVGDCGVSQRVVLAPGAYRFEARMKTAELTTDQGLGFRIFDLENAARLDVRTPAVGGTRDWTPLAAPFTVSPATRLIELRLVRTASLRFDNKLRGRAWIDGVVLCPR
jgi:hypothetical protein